MTASYKMAAPPPDVQFPVSQLELVVKSNKPANQEYRKLVLDAPTELLVRCQAGQFFHLLCPPVGRDTPFLRRPMSLYGFYPETGELHFLYKVTGAGTRGLATLAVGDNLSLVGPLGVPFTIKQDWDHIVLVARGVGLATLAPLALEANRLGRLVTAICSARHPDFLMSIDYFESMGAKVIAVTDAEGTSDMGNVKNIVEHLIADQGVSAFYTCGSNRMLSLLQDMGTRHGIPGQIALEQQMACGIGMCHCCVRPFNRDGEIQQLRVCREGPVFDIAEAVAW